MERRARRGFDASFKVEVARMVQDQGTSIADVCRGMGRGGSNLLNYFMIFNDDYNYY